jgi:hypothetical protein
MEIMGLFSAFVFLLAPILLGWLQYLLLRKQFKNARWWILAQPLGLATVIINVVIFVAIERLIDLPDFLSRIWVGLGFLSFTFSYAVVTGLFLFLILKKQMTE